MKMIRMTTGICVLLAAWIGSPSWARDNIHAVGSSTVYPFMTAVAESFKENTGNPTPTVESTGTGGGFKLFCEGIGEKFPDIANASRPIKQSEAQLCQANNVGELIEVMMGYDGIILASNKTQKPFDLSRAQLFLALAAKIPSKDGKTLVVNPYKKWNEIDPSLPDMKIEVMGPPPTSGTRDAFVELAMEKGCESFDVIKKLPPTEKSKTCATLREDGAYIDAGENDNLIVQKLQTNPHALGIFGYSFLEQNPDKLTAVLIDGIQPSFENITQHTYPVSRSLFVYVKKGHFDVVKGLDTFLIELTSDDAIGPDGYLIEKGLIPLQTKLRKETQAKIVEQVKH